MKIQICTLYVDDQEKALNFYTNILGFEKKAEKLMGDGKMLAVVSPTDDDNVELHLEPTLIPESKSFQKALYNKGLHQAAFSVDDIKKEHATLTIFGVTFAKELATTGDVTRCVIDDTCGNLIQLYQVEDSNKDGQLNDNPVLKRIAVSARNPNS